MTPYERTVRAVAREAQSDHLQLERLHQHTCVLHTPAGPVMLVSSQGHVEICPGARAPHEIEESYLMLTAEEALKALQMWLHPRLNPLAKLRAGPLPSFARKLRMPAERLAQAERAPFASIPLLVRICAELGYDVQITLTNRQTGEVIGEKWGMREEELEAANAVPKWSAGSSAAR